jgi:hypothetical protein
MMTTQPEQKLEKNLIVQLKGLGFAPRRVAND